MWRVLSVVLALLLAGSIWLLGKSVEQHDRNMYVAYRLDLNYRLAAQRRDWIAKQYNELVDVNKYLSEELLLATHEKPKHYTRPY